MRRALVIVLSVVLALVVAAPIASGQGSSQSQNLGELAGEWWNWTASQDPSPLEGNYGSKDARCDGEYVDGVFFLAGTLGGDATRSCIVPAGTPILGPVFNVVCSEAYGVAGQAPPDRKPYDTACAEPIADFVLANGDTYATLTNAKGETVELETQRIESGLFDWNIQFEDNPFEVHLKNGRVTQLPVGEWESATAGLWFYLPEGLDPGKYTLKFGGVFFEGTENEFSLNITYNLTVK